MPGKRRDRVEAVLARADQALEAWFRQSRVTTGQAAILFSGLLKRAAAGLEDVSEHLAPAKPRRRAAGRAAGPATSSPARRAVKRRRPPRVRRDSGPGTTSSRKAA